jgi:anti-sigma regulatory factor (Ser/Thr protein kinase)
MPPSARLTVAAGPSAATSASEWARAIGAQLSLNQQQIYRLDLCITELVTNVASYAYGDRDGVIELNAQAPPAGGELRVEIIDSGTPFDPLDAERPPPSDFPLGGHGIGLVRGFADECSYERRDGQNVFSFTIKR